MNYLQMCIKKIPTSLCHLKKKTTNSSLCPAQPREKNPYMEYFCLYPIGQNFIPSMEYLYSSCGILIFTLNPICPYFIRPVEYFYSGRGKVLIWSKFLITDLDPCYRIAFLDSEIKRIWMRSFFSVWKEMYFSHLLSDAKWLD